MLERSPLSVLVPRTDRWTLRLAVFSVCVVFLCLGISHAWVIYANTRGWMSLILSVIFIVTGVCLWMLKAWARKLTLFILGLIVVIVPLAIASPGFFLDVWILYNGNLPLVLVALATIIVVVVPIFWCMYILDRYKESFG